MAETDDQEPTFKRVPLNEEAPKHGEDRGSDVLTLSLLEDDFNRHTDAHVHPIKTSPDGKGNTGNDQLMPQAVLSFHDISYTVPIPKKCPCVKRSESNEQPTCKVVLDKISGVFRPGLNAIMGPTGGGKSSLLDVLADRKAADWLTGNVLVNGSPRPARFKYMTGYVIQDDTVMGMLTVRENIAFSAALRMPRGTTAEERAFQVEKVIKDLGLDDCADTKVGTELRRGISGGERKRTSIAMELLTSPRILFLDEPTTGLDAAMAYSVMWALCKLSKRDTTVVLSLHQPRFSIFRMLDTLHLLLRGCTVFHGPADQATPFFTSLGYTCVPGDNPADFLLDVLSGHTISASQKNGAAHPNDVDYQKVDEATAVLEVEIDPVELTKQHLVETFRTSDWKAQMDAAMKPPHGDDQQSQPSGTDVIHVSYPTTFLTQLSVVCRRTFFNMVRNPHTLMTQVASSIILSLIIGTIYFQVDSSLKSGIQNRVGAFFFIAMNHVFGNMAAVNVFLLNRALFIHENISGFYRISVYFLATLLCDILPTRIIPITIFSLISYWMIGLRADFVSFIVYLLTVLLTSLSASSVALLMSATVETHTIGTILTSFLWVFMMVFSGLLVNMTSLAPWLQWCKYFSIFSYSLNALTVNELKGIQMCSDTQLGNRTETVCSSGDEYLTKQGIPHDTVWDLYKNLVALIGLTFGFLLLTYIQLRRMKKYR